jgi:hypothetical protein
VLAKDFPAAIDATIEYRPVVIFNGLAVPAFIIGYVIFGIAMIRTSTMPRWSGVLIAVGAPAPPARLRYRPARLDCRVVGALLGSVSLAAGLVWSGYRMWRTGRLGRRVLYRVEEEGVVGP